MKKYLVIGNPISHSLSPKLQNYWIKNHNIDAIYEKEKLNEDELEKLFVNMRNKKVNGANVTVPFKKAVIPFLDKLSAEAKSTQAVNTIYLENDKLIGHNTDIDGFELGIRKINYNISNKKIFILGAGGVVPSIIYALNKMKVSEISIANRTREKAENLKKLFGELKIVEWGEIPDFDMIINATSIGLKKDDKINLNFSSIGKNKLFYDVIYNPKETNFLKTGKELGNVTENGKLMFIYQAISAFNVWHGVRPMVNDEVIKLLD
jgi:shikimate dehydrogenase